MISFGGPQDIGLFANLIDLKDRTVKLLRLRRGILHRTAFIDPLNGSMNLADRYTI